MIEKILERLEELKECDLCNGMLCMDCEEKYGGDGCGTRQQSLAIDECKAIVQEVAKEYGNGWIPCSDRLPEEQDEYLVYWTAEGFKGKCFYEIIEYHLEDGWIGEIPQAPFGKYTVIAWMPLPPKYEPKKTPYQKGE